MSDDHDDLLLGRLALHYKLITQDQLAEATRQQSREGGQRKLGEVLVEGGLLSPRRLEQLLEVQREVLAKRQATAEAAPAPSPPTAAPVPPSLTADLRLDRVLAFAVERSASDVHLHSGAPLKLRLHGRLVEIEPGALEPAAVERAIREILEPAQSEELDRRGQVDLAYTLPGVGRFRANVYRQQRGLDGSFRAIPRQPPTLTELGLPLSLARFANFHQGLVLLTGPAGCGKSATMAALIHLINEDRRDHVISIEDPIEVLHASRRCIVNQRQVGRHTGSFARALRAALREDPDIIAIGELRDLETIQLALTAAETGHLVLATLHTSSAIRTVNRILGVFPPEQQDQIRTMLSESLRGIVSQRLVARADGTGRVPAIEVLVATKAVGNLIRENKTFQIRSVLQTGGSQGMCLLDGALAELVKAGTITREEALRHAEEPQRFSGAAEPAAVSAGRPAA